MPYLAMTGAEIRSCGQLPEKIAYMACHFSPYGTGLTNLPRELPPGSLLILNDRTPIRGHDPALVRDTLARLAEQFRCDGVLLDFQRTVCGESTRIVAALESPSATVRGENTQAVGGVGDPASRGIFPPSVGCVGDPASRGIFPPSVGCVGDPASRGIFPQAVGGEHFPCTVCVTAPHSVGTALPVFVPPVPLLQTPEEYLAPWQGRQVWLEAALDGITVTLTDRGSTTAPLPPGEAPQCPHFDGELLCHYRLDLLKDRAVFTLRRTREDLTALLQRCKAWGITRSVGLWQELVHKPSP